MGWDGPVTHWQFLVWQAWFEQQWNQPSRSDHYAMQTTAAVQGAFGGKITVEPIKFKHPEPVAAKPSSQEYPADFWVPKLMTGEDVMRAKQAVRMAQLQRTSKPTKR